MTCEELISELRLLDASMAIHPDGCVLFMRGCGPYSAPTPEAAIAAARAPESKRAVETAPVQLTMT